MTKCVLGLSVRRRNKVRRSLVTVNLLSFSRYDATVILIVLLRSQYRVWRLIVFIVTSFNKRRTYLTLCCLIVHNHKEVQ